MASINTTIKLQDKMSSVLQKIEKHLNNTNRTLDQLDKKLNKGFNPTKIQETSKQTARTQQQFDVLLQNITKVSKALAELVKNLSKMSTQVGKTTSKFVDVQKSVSGANTQVNRLNRNIQNTNGSVTKVNASFRSLPRHIERTNTAFGKLTTNTSNLNTTVGTVNRSLNRMPRGVDKTLNAFDRLKKAVSGLPTTLGNFSKSLVNATKNTSSLSKATSLVKTTFVQITNTIRRTNGAMSRLSGTTSKLVNVANRFKSALSRLPSSIGNLGTKFVNIGNHIRRNTEASKRFSASLRVGSGLASSLMFRFQGLAGIIGGLATAKGLITTADSMTQVRNKMNLLTKDATQTQATMDKVYQAALRSRAGYAVMADSVAKIGIRAGHAFGNNVDQIIAFTETFNKMGVVSGSTAEEMNAALLQITQALGAGVLRGDEFRSVIEHVPLVIDAVAKEMGVPIEQVKKLSTEGQITADVLKRAMLNAASDMDKKVKGMQYTWGQLWQLIQNFALKVFDPLLRAISNIVQSDRFINFCNTVGNAFKALAPVATFVFNKITEAIGWLWDKFSKLIPHLQLGWNILKEIGKTIYNQWIPAWHEVESALKTVWDKIVQLYEYIKANWSSIAPIFWTIVAALIAYKIVVIAISVATAVWAVVSNVLFWKVLLIGLAIAALIFAFYKIISVINEWLGTSISATGVIFGCFAFLASVIWNWVAFVWNIIMSLIEFFVNVWDHPEYAIKMFFLNLAKTGQEWCIAMSGFAQTVADAIVDAVGWAVNQCIDLINWLIDCLPSKAQDFLGVKGGISHVDWEAPNFKAKYQENLDEINKMISDLEKPEDYWEAPRAGFLDIENTTKKAYNFGEGLENMAKSFNIDDVTSKFNFDEIMKKAEGNAANGNGINDVGNALGNKLDPIDKALKGINDNTDKIAGSSAKTADNTSGDEDLSWMREMAIRNATNAYTNNTTQNFRVTNNNQIAKEVDSDSFMNKLCETLMKRMASGTAY